MGGDGRGWCDDKPHNYFPNMQMCVHIVLSEEVANTHTHTYVETNVIVQQVSSSPTGVH